MTKIKRFSLGLLVSLGLVGSFAVAPVVSANPVASPLTTVAKSWKQCDSTFLGFPPWYRHMEMTNDCAPKFTKLNDVWIIALNVVDMLIRAAGLVAIGFIIWGGFKYMKSQGEPSAIAEAKTVIVNSVVGLVIVIISVTIVQYVAGAIGG